MAKHVVKVGPMYLLQVRSTTVDCDTVTVKFGDCSLNISTLYAFVLENHTVRASTELKTGDLVWIDIPTFISAGVFKKDTNDHCVSLTH
jgi:hypothetical protein